MSELSKREKTVDYQEKNGDEWNAVRERELGGVEEE